MAADPLKENSVLEVHLHILAADNRACKFFLLLAHHNFSVQQGLCMCLCSMLTDQVNIHVWFIQQELALVAWHAGHNTLAGIVIVDCVPARHHQLGKLAGDEMWLSAIVSCNGTPENAGQD